MDPECTLCGQGVLYLVEIIPAGFGIYILCSECEAMWKPEDAYDPALVINFDEFMQSQGLKPVWENLRKLKRISSNTLTERTDLDPNLKAALIRMDLHDSCRPSDCLGGVTAFPVGVQQMRIENDDSNFAHKMIAETRLAFERLQPHDRDGIMFVAASAQDVLYRHLMKLTMFDRFTRAYSLLMVRYFFECLSEQSIRTFYILDNTLRDDRFEAVLELFELSGIGTTTPRRDGSDWPTLASRLAESLDAMGHVAYIQPDATVNHLAGARQLASKLPCIATFRNRDPQEAEYEIINFRAPNTAEPYI